MVQSKRKCAVGRRISLAFRLTYMNTAKTHTHTNDPCTSTAISSDGDGCNGHLIKKANRITIAGVLIHARELVVISIFTRPISIYRMIESHIFRRKYLSLCELILGIDHYETGILFASPGIQSQKRL